MPRLWTEKHQWCVASCRTDGSIFGNLPVANLPTSLLVNNGDQPTFVGRSMKLRG